MMSYISISFYILFGLTVILYYMFPVRLRWTVLLAGSVFFYCFAAPSLRSCIFFLATILLGWLLGFFVGRVRHAFILCLCSLLPLIAFKLNTPLTAHPLLVPLGISYYSLQLYSYLSDVRSGRIAPQRNPFKFILYMSFFPQIVQGPIPRYDKLSDQLFNGNGFDSRNIVSSMELIVWGFFLKYMIADKADVVVGEIFGGYTDMTGAVILLGAILYSIQLYADFLACVTIARGTAIAFGIRLRDNFHHPYFAPTVQDFWRRWHMSLSFWLRDYVYIPLGGSRKGVIRKYINLVITFLVSGFWHGGLAPNYLFWGLLHALYQIAGSLTIGVRNRLLGLSRLTPDSFPVRLFRAAVTSFLVMVAWVIFRADTLAQGLDMLKMMFTTTTWPELKELMPAIIRMGAFMDPKEWYVLGISIALLLAVSLAQSRVIIKDVISRLWLPFRWFIYIAAIITVAVFGSYGSGFNAADFIYGSF